MDDEATSVERREFLKVAALSALGSLALPGCTNSSAAETPAAPRTVTILGMLDVAQALADNSLENNLYWLDNNKAAGSLYQGTGHLRTAIRKGDVVQWVVSGLEVETVADIVGITGAAAAVANPVATPIAPGFSLWLGQIAATGSGIYSYDVALKVESRTMTASAQLALDVL